MTFVFDSFGSFCPLLLQKCLWSFGKDRVDFKEPRLSTLYNLFHRLFLEHNAFLWWFFIVEFSFFSLHFVERFQPNHPGLVHFHFSEKIFNVGPLLILAFAIHHKFSIIFIKLYLNWSFFLLNVGICFFKYVSQTLLLSTCTLLCITLSNIQLSQCIIS